MKCFGRLFAIALAILLTLGVLPATVAAEINDPLVIDSQVLSATGFPQGTYPSSLMVQATSWPGSSYRYILTVGDFSPWPMSALRILDRYLPADPSQPEIDYEWFPGPLEAGQVTSVVVNFPKGALAGGCHQLEISLASGLSTILMDCNAPGATTVWNVPLTEAMNSYLARPPLTRALPMGPSKLGLHVTSTTSPAIMDFVRQAHPAVIVAVDGFDWLKEVKAISPGTITVGRFGEGDQTFSGDPVQRAREFVSANASRYLASPAVDYWLGWNEPVVQGVEQMRWFATFEAERVAAMSELGLKAAVGNFSTGKPEADEFEAFLPAVAAAKKHAGALALHEYSAPSMRDGVGMGIPGLTASNERGALTLRFRFWYDHYLRPNNLVVPLIITEAGIDGGVLRTEGNPLAGWRDFFKDALERSTTEAGGAYAEQLSWYDDQLRRDPYVLGFAIFNAGDLSGKWQSFDVISILPQLADVIKNKN